MAEPRDIAGGAERPEGASAPVEGAADAQNVRVGGWRDLWQVPTLLVGVVALAGALVLAVVNKPGVDYERLLSRGARLLEDGRALEAIDALNEDVFPFEAKGDLPGWARARYYLLLARAMYLGQRQLDVINQENLARILEAYTKAERSGAELEDRDFEAIAQTHLDAGRIDQGVQWGERIVDDGRRRRVLRRAIEVGLRQGGQEGQERVLALLARMLDEEGLSVEDRAWVVERQTRALMEQGFTEEAIAKLLREMQRLEGLEASRRADLLLLLARAYLDVGAWEQAGEQLALVEGLIGAGDSRLGEVFWMRGLILDAEGESELAREHLLTVLSEYPSSPAVVPATLALAEIESRLGLQDASLSHYERLRDLLREGRSHRRAGVEEATRSMLARSREAIEAGRYGHAVRLARLSESLYDGEAVPDEVLLQVGMAERAMGLALLDARDEKVGRPRSVDDLDPVQREEARRHLIAAGSALMRHARRMVAKDFDAFGDSLFLAADSFDRAGDQGEAINAFREFSDAFPDDPRRAEARYRLAQAYEARGDVRLAEEMYRGLVRDRADPSTKNVGIYGDLAHVPLARLLAVDDDPSNDGEAESLLRRIVDGEIVREPDTDLFRDAMYALGDILAMRGRHEEAIAVLDEALARFPDGDQARGARYRLAGALRARAREIEEALSQALPPSERARLEAERRASLERSEGLYAQVIEELEAIDTRRRSPTEHVMLRNASFYRAACAHELGDLDRAIALYDEAYARFPDDPASLVALTRIVDIHLARGDVRRAAVANERARRFFASLPDEVWDDPMLPMSRSDWERWLSATAQLASVGEEGGP